MSKESLLPPCGWTGAAGGLFLSEDQESEGGELTE